MLLLFNGVQRTISRSTAIEDLRRALIALTDDSTSVCEVVGRLGVFCGGHRRLSDEELEETYDWLVERQKPENREQLEDLANRWQLSQQSVTETDLACDVQTEDRHTCLGWDEFTNEELEKHYQTLKKEVVRIE